MKRGDWKNKNQTLNLDSKRQNYFTAQVKPTVSKARKVYFPKRKKRGNSCAKAI